MNLRFFFPGRDMGATYEGRIGACLLSRDVKNVGLRGAGLTACGMWST